MLLFTSVLKWIVYSALQVFQVQNFRKITVMNKTELRRLLLKEKIFLGRLYKRLWLIWFASQNFLHANTNDAGDFALTLVCQIIVLGMIIWYPRVNIFTKLLGCKSNVIFKSNSSVARKEFAVASTLQIRTVLYVLHFMGYFWFALQIFAP